MPEISIIVPAYNVDKYIDKSMECLMKQTFQDFEVIIIDDGSTDNTGLLCDNIAKKDIRFKVFHKNNEGVSAARNDGLDRVTGNYITFVDSDDWVTEDYLEYLLWLINLDKKAEISMTVGAEVNECALPINIAETRHEVLSTSDAVKRMLLRETYRHANWGKLYKKSIWENVRFPKHVIYDDYDTTYRAYANSSTVVCGNAIKYSYVQRNGSLMHARCSEKTLSVLDVADTISDFMIKTWPENAIYVRDMQVATYLKNMQAILNTGINAFPEYQKRIMNTIRRNAKVLLLAKETPRNDKLKIVLILLNKRLFVQLYNWRDGNIKMRN